MTLFGILMFLLTIALSVLTPAAYYACDYVKVGLSSPENFVNRFEIIFDDAQLTRRLSQCSKNGTGEII